MKLCRFGAPGSEKPGLIDAQDRIRDLSAHLADITPADLSAEGLARIAAVDVTSLPVVDGEPRYGVPFSGTRQFVAIGLNYADHAAESNLPIPSEPVVFNKWISCLQGPNDPVTIPKDSLKTDWEVELGIVIGTAANNVSEADALGHVAGYVVVNDVSERHWQTERGPTWDKGKGFPTFGPVGPWLVTADEVGDPQALSMWLDVNGKRMQDGSTKTMIFTVAEIVAYCSKLMTLLPGDIITTGTPPGVGLGQKPEPWYLKAGDIVELGIEKLGRQRQEFVAWTGATA
ncbi:2-keto-4-pentenoate hydratase/2-oxohepta-3-ene-1,7-dioic acid hydratase in catechol pathway [Sphingomonas jinjuensis]|uniref:2-keto-4-pentenoate hydratase/2-oxohepta-3-ene-1,7-dioic acid hydratase in catechol pathway n=1 Tax=Sphingomonas jinjuensis TaxID=535907 RepID=A0A840FK96_9SPHN|nr:fumarylacetoacetate hydrolase family protein [Sphingomonas jinjuensis]MBB4154368.1 2-keto-4-pentenoate hydratase/2-oxohepta-3-ene-1,7-dioic acid hydratase in catechol pathway [Sphingomonas jinjuensis]